MGVATKGAQQSNAVVVRFQGVRILFSPLLDSVIFCVLGDREVSATRLQMVLRRSSSFVWQNYITK
jgi:hypothetical protein